MEENIYKNKYLKYKEKYLNLKQSGGNNNIILGIIYQRFFNTYFEIFMNTELPRYIITKYLPEYNDHRYNYRDLIPRIGEIKEKIFKIEIWSLITSDLINLFNILYELMNEGKIKSDINIFSLSTGTGFVEALFAIYLKIYHEKEIVRLMFFDIYDTTEILLRYTFINTKKRKNENVFDSVIGLLQKINYSENGIAIQQLDILLNRPNPSPALRKLYLDDNFRTIDIFIAINPQTFKYKYNGRIFKTVLVLNKYIELLIRLHPNISAEPMLWLYCDPRLNFINRVELKKSLIEINKEYAEDDKILDYFSLSTINNLHKIGIE